MDLPARVRNSESEPKKNNLASELLVVFLACVFLDCVCVQNKSKIFKMAAYSLFNITFGRNSFRVLLSGSGSDFFS